LAAFIKSEEKKSTYMDSGFDFTDGLGASTCVACPFQAHQLTYL